MNRSRMLRRAALAGLLPLMPSASHALDLIGSYEKARRFDPSIRASGEAVIAGREKAVQGDALLKPQVSLTAAYSHVDDRSKTTLPPALQDVIKAESAGRVHQAALQLKHPLYDARATADRKELHQRTELAEISFLSAQQDLMQRVSEAYLNVLLARETLRVVRAEKEAVHMQRSRTQARFDVGRGKITEVQETQARYDAVLTKEISALSTLELREAQFSELTGEPTKMLDELRTDFVPEHPQPDDLKAWQRRGMHANTRVRGRQSELEIATAEIAKYTLKGRPTLDLVGSYTVKGQNGGLSPVISPDNNRMAVIGVQLNVPLFSGGSLNSRERESLAKKREAEFQVTAAERDARLQIQDAFLEMKTGVSRIRALEQSVVSARTALEATSLGRDVGSRTDLDVLDAEQRVYANQLDLAQARNAYLLGRVRLASATGELSEDDLRVLNGYLVRGGR